MRCCWSVVFTFVYIVSCRASAFVALSAVTSLGRALMIVRTLVRAPCRLINLFIPETNLPIFVTWLQEKFCGYFALFSFCRLTKLSAESKIVSVQKKQSAGHAHVAQLSISQSGKSKWRFSGFTTSNQKSRNNNWPSGVKSDFLLISCLAKWAGV